MNVTGDEERSVITTLFPPPAVLAIELIVVTDAVKLPSDATVIAEKYVSEPPIVMSEPVLEEPGELAAMESPDANPLPAIVKEAPAAPSVLPGVIVIAGAIVIELSAVIPPSVNEVLSEFVS